MNGGMWIGIRNRWGRGEKRRDAEHVHLCSLIIVNAPPLYERNVKALCRQHEGSDKKYPYDKCDCEVKQVTKPKAHKGEHPCIFWILSVKNYRNLFFQFHILVFFTTETDSLALIEKFNNRE